MRLLDPRFVYTPSHSTNVRRTFERFGFRATTQAEREARQKGIRVVPQLNVHRATLTSE
jgi:hypothetical protein